jgi:hypothetical protein
MRCLAIFTCAFALAVPAAGGFALGGHPKAKVLECDQDARSVTFRGSMVAFRRATTLQMRFGLQARSPGDTSWNRSSPDGFDEWLTADPGVDHYILDKEITGLVTGAYRATVRFRWRNPKGVIVGRAFRRTKTCRQPDPRANLLVEQITMGAGGDSATRTYTVTVANDGETEAPLFATSLLIGDTTLKQATVEPLVEGDDAALTFTGPECKPGSELVATADSEAQVDESDEMDNALTVPCPVAARNAWHPSLD